MTSDCSTASTHRVCGLVTSCPRSDVDDCLRVSNGRVELLSETRVRETVATVDDRWITHVVLGEAA